jgi:hypothetical protein
MGLFLRLSQWTMNARDVTRDDPDGFFECCTLKEIIMRTLVCICALGLAAVSCNDLSDINVDPNNPASARPQEVLTSILGSSAFVMDYAYNHEAFLWGQYWTWGVGVSLGENARYIQHPRDANQAWAKSYSNALADIEFLKDIKDPAFNGIGKVLEAFLYQYLVDHFGDVPYSQAVQGAIAEGSVLAPAYDDDATIYPQLVATIDAAIHDLERAQSAQLTAVGAEDLMYGGELNNWIRFAHSLKLRILMRMSDVVDVSEQIRSTIADGSFIENAVQIAEVSFTGDHGSENPMYARLESRYGNFYLAATTVTKVCDEFADPRKFYFYKEAVNYPGEIIGLYPNGDCGFICHAEDWSSPADVTYGAAAPTILLSDWETWFLRAEAAVRFGTRDNAVIAFENALIANFEYLDAPDGADFAASLHFGEMDDPGKIHLIATMKWLSMTGLQEAEGWIESRRFDTPENPIFTGQNGIYQTPINSALGQRVFPTRWRYPESEQNLNPNFPGQTTITAKVFWDR